MNLHNRTLFTADNLPILRSIDSDSVDLIYLDPPFNTGKQWENPIEAGSKKAIASFKDTWHAADVHVDDAYELGLQYPATISLIRSLQTINGGSWYAYLIYMGVRLAEMRRILKDSGSIYYHCDSVMSHGIKLLMDAIFGKNNFRNEIIWRRSNSHNDGKKFGVITDTLLFYSKTKKYTFNASFIPRTESETKEEYPRIDKNSGKRYKSVSMNAAGQGEGKVFGDRGLLKPPTGTHWRWSQERINDALEQDIIFFSANNVPRYKQFAENIAGKQMQNLWFDFMAISSQAKERTGYPTQKPEALLERIIKASSNKGDFVLDPFCGCATACVAAEKLYRQWVGIDLSETAADIVLKRLRKLAEVPLADHEAVVNHVTEMPKRTDIDKIKDISSFKVELYKKQDSTCPLCREKTRIGNMDLDHIIPRANGGQNYPHNYQLLCRECNSMKGSKTMETARKEAIKRRIEQQAALERIEWEAA